METTAASYNVTPEELTRIGIPLHDAHLRSVVDRLILQTSSDHLLAVMKVLVSMIYYGFDDVFDTAMSSLALLRVSSDERGSFFEELHSENDEWYLEIDERYVNKINKINDLITEWQQRYVDIADRGDY